MTEHRKENGMYMDTSEIIYTYRNRNVSSMLQVKNLAELNLVTKKEMARWLVDHGEDVDKRILLPGGGKPVKENKIPNQTAKADAGKPRLSLVPTQIIYEIAKVRMYGCEKYPEGGKDNWKDVEPERYFEALLRHIFAAWDDYTAKDTESGLMHLSHAACNLAFLLELIKQGENHESNNQTTV